ncbi:MAG: DedA family protein [Acidimicrobiia bacterium]|nr:DedA family protein [Acidimicrobiia bacterium]
MDFLSSIVDFILNFDGYLRGLIESVGPWVYVILFLIITAETGLVIAPLLPGDSLLFAAGTFAALSPEGEPGAAPLLNVWIIFFTLGIAAVLGDALNYAVGRYLGPKLFRKEDSRFFKKENLDRTHDFFEKYGPITIIIARFLPIVRTFAPFVAGMGRMGYPRFLTYNVVGGVGWVGLFVFAGYFFANIPFVQDHFELVIIGIVLVSVVPTAIEVIRRRRKAAAAAVAATGPNTEEP